MALEDRVDADLALGRGAELVAELEALVDEQPLRERLRGQLLLALYRSGRQADALEAYQAARRALVGELGIEPGPRLRELHQAILEQDAALDRAPRRRPAEAAPAGVFVGRSRELEALRAGVEDAFAGRGRLSCSPGARDRQEPPRRGAGAARARPRRDGRSSGAAGRRAARRPTGRGSRRCGPTCAPATTETLAEQAGAGAADLAQVIPELADRCRVSRRRPRSSRTSSASGSSTRPPSSCAGSARRGRSCSCSTTSTRPTRPRCCSCASSRASSARPAAAARRLPRRRPAARAAAGRDARRGRPRALLPADRAGGLASPRWPSTWIAPRRSWPRRGSRPRCTSGPRATRCSSASSCGCSRSRARRRERLRSRRACATSSPGG